VSPPRATSLPASMASAITALATPPSAATTTISAPTTSAPSTSVTATFTPTVLVLRSPFATIIVVKPLRMMLPIVILRLLLPGIHR